MDIDNGDMTRIDIIAGIESALDLTLRGGMKWKT